MDDRGAQLLNPILAQAAFWRRVEAHPLARLRPWWYPLNTFLHDFPAPPHNGDKTREQMGDTDGESGQGCALD